MMLRKKLFRQISIVLMLIISVSLFTACGYITVDNERDLAQIVARVTVTKGENEKEDIEISKKQLYESYASNYSSMSEQGYSAEEAMDQCLTSLVNQKIYAIAAREQFKFNSADSQSDPLGTDYFTVSGVKEYSRTIGNTRYWASQGKSNIIAEAKEKGTNSKGEVIFEHKDELFLSIYEINSVRQNINEAVRTELERHVTEIREVWGIEVDDADTDDFVYEAPKAWATRDSDIKTFTDVSQTDFIRPYELNTNTGNAEVDRVNREAVKRFEKQLQDLKRTVPELYERELSNKLVTKIQEYKQAEYEIDAYGDGSSIVASEIDSQIRQLYQNILRRNKETYTSDETGISAFASDFDAATEIILYYPVGGYFYVNHILVPFSSAQTAELARLTAHITQAAEKERETQRIKELQFTQIQARARSERTGVEIGELIPISSITSEVFNAMNYIDPVNPSSGTLLSRETKLDRFTSLVYKYNTDEGMFQEDRIRGYAVGPTNTSLDPAFYEGAHSALKSESGLYGPVMSTYGAHYIFVTETFGPKQELDLYSPYGSKMRRDNNGVFRQQTVYDVLKEKVVQQYISDTLGKFQVSIAIDYDDFEDTKVSVDLFESLFSSTGSSSTVRAKVDVVIYPKVVAQFFKSWPR